MAIAPKVLLVEDDLSLLKIYSNKLKLSGFDVSVATTGDEAVRKAQTEQPAVMLLDLILPNQDGFIVLEELKKNPQTAGIPVIVLSNLGQDADRKRARELGAVDYLIKSDVSLQDVVARARAQLQSS